MENKLTIKMVEDAIKSLPKPPQKLVFKKSALLRTTQTVIKQGNEITYPDDIESGEITVIEFPEFNYELKPESFIDVPLPSSRFSVFIDSKFYF